MQRRQRRAIYYFSALVSVLFLYTIAYRWGMSTFEGRERGFFEALLFVVETFTTTGYGEDAFWQTPEMIVVVVSMMLTGVFFIFMAFPLFVVPWIEERLSASAPTDAGDLADHVVVCAFTERSETLVDELAVRDVPYVVLERDREAAEELHASGTPVVHGDPESVDALERANLGVARTVVADVGDETNASVALAADQIAGDDVDVITFAEDADLAEYHRYAGADAVFTPRRLIGESLATKVTAGLSTDVDDAVLLDDDFEIAELPVQPGSELDGVRVAESDIRERTGANIVGGWFRGEFLAPPAPETLVDRRTVLLVAGREEQIEALKELTRSEARTRRHGPVVVCGYGEVGSTVKQAVSAASLPCLAVDVEERPGVDVVGDATDPQTLRDASVTDATTVILTLPDDTLAVFATLVLRELDPDVEIVARASGADGVAKLYRAGADYVLALPTVSGRMLASTIVDEDVLSFGQQVEVVRMPAGRLAGQTIAEADVRAQTACTVIAVERDGRLITDVDPSFRFARGDDLVATGPDAGITELAALVAK